MKCMNCNKKLFPISTEFTFTKGTMTIKAINVPALHCNCCGKTYIDETVKEKAKGFARVYLEGNVINYAECEAAEIVATMSLLL